MTARIRRSELNYRDADEMRIDADKLITVSNAGIRRMAKELLNAADRLAHCRTCQPVITVPVNSAGEIVPTKAYATHELTCPSNR